jgi:uncharacterized protein
MKEYKLPTPQPRPESIPFWDGCNEGKFLLQYCDDCGTINWFPRTHCVKCAGSQMTWKPASGFGVLETFSIVYRPMNPAWASEVPYMLGLVRLAEGIRMVTRIISSLGEATPMGCAVRVAFVSIGENMKLPFFEVVEPCATD